MKASKVHRPGVAAVLMWVGSGGFAFARESGAVDPHPYQTQCFYRIGAGSGNAGQLEVIAPARVPEYRFYPQGDPVMQTETNTMLVFDKRNPLTATETAGSNYLFLAGGYLATISAEGFLNYKGKVTYTPEAAGGVYFVASGTREVYAVDSYGFVVPGGRKAGELKVIGGNYFIDKTGLLTTIKSLGASPNSGLGIVIEKRGWSFPDVLKAGGVFFYRANGTLVTIESATGNFKDGIVPSSKPALAGGNYFVGEDRVLYTVSNEGTVRPHPEVLVVGEPLVSAYSWLKLEDGTLVVIDADGNPHRSVVRISTTGVRAEVVKTLESDPDPKSVFMPKILN